MKKNWNENLNFTMVKNIKLKIFNLLILISHNTLYCKNVGF